MLVSLSRPVDLIIVAPFRIRFGSFPLNPLNKNFKGWWDWGKLEKKKIKAKEYDSSTGTVYLDFGSWRNRKTYFEVYIDLGYRDF